MSPPPPEQKTSGVNLYTRWVPGTELGDYTLEVTQTVTTQGGGTLWTFRPPARRFTVGAPLYSLGTDDVLTAFPAPGSLTSSGHLLPYVSLRNPYLPWERPLALPTTGLPWMTLLLMAEDETDPVVRTGLADVLLDPAKAPKDTVLPHPPGPLPPDTPCTVLDVSAERWLALMPETAELSLLAHVRERAAASGVGPPAVGQIIGNRFPRPLPPAAGAAPAVERPCAYTGHLVSLAGHETTLTTPPQAPHHVRLVSLWSWTFTVAPDLEESAFTAFEAMHDNNAGTGGRLRVPQTKASAADTTAAKRLRVGYLPVPHHLASGEPTTAWYRGPAIPAPAPAPDGWQTLHSCADEALVYLPGEGMFDISLAVAWTLGCQLVLSRRDLCETMLEWKGKALRHAQALALTTHPDTAGRPLNPVALPGSLTGARPDAGQLAALADRRRLRRDFTAAMADGLGSRVTAAVGPAPALRAVPDPAPDTAEGPERRTAATAVPVLDHVRGLLADQETAAALRTALAADITPHLGRTRGGTTGDEYLWDPVAMLALVPTWYLLPLPDAVLPQDSVRVFHLDEQWLSTFADGMLSIGTYTALDHALNPVLKDILFTPRAEAPLARCGLLLRSPLMRHWPQDPAAPHGQEFIFTAEGAKVTVRRLLGPETVLLLFDAVPSKVVLREPAHVLQFGLDDHGKVRMRDENGTVTDTSIDVLGPDTYTRPPVSGTHRREVLRVAHLLDAMAAAQGETQKNAENFAFHLLHPPAVLEIRLDPTA
ncbi:hypothetical protein ACH41E_29695 [Streptomyces sp. NPDC020412]|uniref:hypothetical protein n=1 Tax=Streptomyces sp. NPDC020412 TaxID=3365073 RepID=UPI0037A3D493